MVDDRDAHQHAERGAARTMGVFGFAARTNIPTSLISSPVALQVMFGHAGASQPTDPRVADVVSPAVVMGG